ncbi:hypothetical protein [Burkholderia cenocepacia]|uniref:hypothetical protein n=1 Tax=Burkholderia cenocepacia TaxID=95486 RepID=UPI002AB2C1F0|nr:hypothetical protein [Burkholderia cenocepacia]
MSTVKTQKLSKTPASAKRAKGPASKSATANRELFGSDGDAGLATAAAKRGGSGPAVRRATTSRVSATQQPVKATPKKAASVGSVRINFDLEKTTHKRLKMLAVEAEMTIADWMRALIQKELEHIGRMERRGK